MKAPSSSKGVHGMLLALLALVPAAVFAQQDNASQRQSLQDPVQQETAAAKTEATRKQTEPSPTKTEEDAKLISVQGGKALGMSVLGNQEAPTALVIVPWKSSELGGALDISPMLDDSRLPIDKEVFMRMLSYYEIRSETARTAAPADMTATQPASAPSKTIATQPAAAAQRRKP